MTVTTDMTPATTTDFASMASQDQDFDLLTIQEAMQDFSWLTINHPRTGEPTSMRIKVAGPDSETYKSIDRRVSNKRLNAIRKAKNGLTVEQLTAFDFEMIIGITLDWEKISWSGEPLPFSQDNAKMIYTEFPFIRDQVNEFAGDRANFFSN